MGEGGSSLCNLLHVIFVLYVLLCHLAMCGFFGGDSVLGLFNPVFLAVFSYVALGWCI